MQMKLISVISLCFHSYKNRLDKFAEKDERLAAREFVTLRKSMLLHRLLVQVNRLLTYPHWLPVQTSQISFYVDELISLYETFQNFTIRDMDFVSELVTDPTLHVLVSRILEYLKQNDHVSTDLNPIGDRLAFEVALIYKASTQDFAQAGASAFPRFAAQFYFDRNVFQQSDLTLPCQGMGSQYSASQIYFDKNIFQQWDLTLPYTYGNVGSSDYLGRRRETEKEYLSQDFPSQFYFDKNKSQPGEDFIGFQEEANNLLQQLASITRKQLEVISIVGMAGLGKSTLTRRLYNHPYVVSYFYARAWVTCSQDYHKRDLLLSILKSVCEIGDEVCSMNDYMLALALYRALKGRRYLIVIDDMWSIQAWDDFKRCFPDDNNGSKILLTTRLKGVALHAQSKGKPLFLRFLTEEESFDLFRKKAFIDGNFYGNLTLIGRSISSKCRGLPLAIVVIAGVLKNNLDRNWWVQVAESVSSYILTDENQYIDTLALSYNHLPLHLRPCFLSFGAFSEYHDVPVVKLIRLWIAEGFIHQDCPRKSLENVAEDYLLDLIGRSLVVVVKKGSTGAIKTCRIHDLLRDLCLRKADEDKFSSDIYKYDKHSYSCSHSFANPSTEPQLLLSTNALAIPSNCSCYSSEVPRSFLKDVPVLWGASRHIRSLDISSIELFVFPSELLQLVHLRYLELRFRSGNPPDSICHLRKLQTLIMSSRRNMIVPKNIWKLINLRHLCIKSGENLVNFSTVEEELSLMENLQTMSLVSPTRQCQDILARSRNLQKLGLCGPMTTKIGDFKFPDLGLLVHLKTLKLLNTIPLSKAVRLSTSCLFPGSLKNLTMSNTSLAWQEARIFELIPNLVVLKLKFHAFVGEAWETSPEAFPRLKFLKLDDLDIMTMTVSRNHFPVLQCLHVCRCPSLKEIPEDFGNICTLKWIELSGCSDSATNSARDIQKEQERNGNDWLKIIVNRGLTKHAHNRAGGSGY